MRMVTNLLYTKEDAESARRVEVELKVPDPKSEIAKGVLLDEKKSDSAVCEKVNE